MKRVLVDVDDTIENLLEAWVAYLNKKYNLEVKPEDCFDWDMSYLFPMLTSKQIFEVLGDEDLWKSVKPKDGSAFYLERLQNEGFDIVLVTSSEYFNIRPKIEFVLQKYFKFIPLKNIIVTSRKQLIKGNVLVDDYIKNLEGGDYQKILVNCYHNRLVDTTGTDIIRANTWKEIYTIIHLMLD